MSKNMRACTLLLATISAAAAAPATPPRQHSGIGMAHARAIALKAAPGKVISAEYEKEGGAWRYSFDIKQKGNIQEIGVDSKTGKIVENKSEGKVDHD